MRAAPPNREPPCARRSVRLERVVSAATARRAGPLCPAPDLLATDGSAAGDASAASAAPRVGWLAGIARGALIACALTASSCSLIYGPRDSAARILDSSEVALVQRWIEAARADTELRQTVRLYARAKLTTPDGVARVREAILASRSGALRLETLNFLGQTQSLLVTDGTAAAFFDGAEIERDAAPSEMLARLGLDVDPAEITRLLLAAPPLPEEPPARLWAEGSVWVADYVSSQLRFAPDGSLRAVSVRRRDRSIRYLAEFDGWQTVAGGQFPASLALEFPRTGLRAELVVQEVELNAELDAMLFELASPGAE